MDGPSVELDATFEHPFMLVAPVRELLGGDRVPVTRVFSGDEWPAVLAAMRPRLEERLGHPLTECIAEWHPDCRAGRLYTYEELAPKSRVALVTNGTLRRLRFRSYAKWRHHVQHHVDHPLQPGTLLVIDDVNLRRWQPELLGEPGEGQNVRLFFRYRISSPA